MTRKASEKPPRTVKKPHSALHRSKLREKVREVLSQKRPELDLQLVTLELIGQTYQWDSLYEQVDGVWQASPLEAQAINISSYLPRKIQALGKVEPSASLAPQKRELDSIHGVAYALAIALQADSERWSVVESCRMYYWQQATAPFPWLTPDGQKRYHAAQQEAHQWLSKCEQEDGTGEALLTCKVRVERFASVRAAVSELSLDQETSAGRVERRHPLASYLRQLADALEGHDLEILSLQLSDLLIPETELYWNGRGLRLPGNDAWTPYRVYEDGVLENLYSACMRVAEVDGWDMKRALHFILTGHPPLPQRLNSSREEGRRALTPLSFDHIALLQLTYMTPGQTWPQRLNTWDGWQNTFPEEGFRLTFRNQEDSGIPTTDHQRAAWMRQESQRAVKRALRFVSSIVHEEW